MMTSFSAADQTRPQQKKCRDSAPSLHVLFAAMSRLILQPPFLQRDLFGPSLSRETCLVPSKSTSVFFFVRISLIKAIAPNCSFNNCPVSIFICFTLQLVP